MFERYTEKARRVIFFARYEACQHGSHFIETEHLLLGLLREEKALFLHLLPNLDEDSIRDKVAAHARTRKPVSTSIDLPLSDKSKWVLKYAADEADRLNHRHIGSEHLLLGLLHDKEDSAAKLLHQGNANYSAMRHAVEKLPQAFAAQSKIYAVPGHRSRVEVYKTVEIHGTSRNAEHISAAVNKCRENSWHWRKSSWTPLDVVINLKTADFSFDLSLAADSANFKLVQGGWKKDHCAICHWDLFESKDDPTHGTGYTNGRDWVCQECYEKFWARPDFLSATYDDIT
jgi:hypothetical protein